MMGDTVQEGTMIWRKLGAARFQVETADRVYVVQQADQDEMPGNKQWKASWRKLADAPPSLREFTWCQSRREAFDWCGALHHPGLQLMHLIAGADGGTIGGRS